VRAAGVPAAPTGTALSAAAVNVNANIASSKTASRLNNRHLGIWLIEISPLWRNRKRGSVSVARIGASDATPCQLDRASAERQQNRSVQSGRSPLLQAAKNV
jgi:hypothetical protein